MTLELDTRQRAMLQEMGVHVWLPETGVALLEKDVPLVQQAKQTPVAAVAPVSVSSIPVRPPAHAVTPSAEVPITIRAAAAAPVPFAPGSPAVPQLAAPLDWSALSEAVSACQACAMCSGRTKATLLVPPGNAAQCDWMLVGDVPDEDEDRAGAPFAGQDGVLLANMLRALGLQRANPVSSSNPSTVLPQPATTSTLPAQRAYVTNVLKCRPPMGSMPQATELAQCAAYLQREMALVQPKIILAMGRFANQVLLAESPALVTQPLGRLRGTLHRYQGVPVVVTYPPKLLMRNSADKAKAWSDLCFAAAALDAAQAG
jgi:DNA polymerase